MSPGARRAMMSQFLGFGMDAYDMAMVVVLSSILAKVFAFPRLGPTGRFLIVALLYAATAAARLLGIPLYKILIYAAVHRSLPLALAAAILAASFKVAWGIVPAYAVLTLGAAATFVSLLWTPETKEVDLAAS